MITAAVIATVLFIKKEMDMDDEESDDDAQGKKKGTDEAEDCTEGTEMKTIKKSNPRIDTSRNNK